MGIVSSWGGCALGCHSKRTAVFLSRSFGFVQFFELRFSDGVDSMEKYRWTHQFICKKSFN